MKDIENIEDIKLMVDTFYSRVKQDDLIGHIFNARIKDRWPQHLEKMYGFWQTILLNEPVYKGSSFEPHAALPINKSHFERWLNLFNTTVDSLFTGEKANEAKLRAANIATVFNYKIEYLKNNLLQG